MISLQIKYSTQSYLTGDVVAIRESGFNYSEGDCLKAWLESGRKVSDWKSTFVIVYLSDHEDINSPELNKLLELYSTEDQPKHKRKYYIQMPPDPNNLHRENIRLTGETVATLAEVVALTEERT